MARLRTLVALVAAGLVATMVQGGTAQAVNIGNEGCTPGYWKQTQHFDSWQEYKPTRSLYYFFRQGGQNGVGPSAFDTAVPEVAAFANLTALQGLRLQGGPGVSGAAEILLRASVAAYLNAATEELGYPYRRYHVPFDMNAQLTAALASGDRGQMLALAATLDAANNLGCPLS